MKDEMNLWNGPNASRNENKKGIFWKKTCLSRVSIEFNNLSKLNEYLSTNEKRRKTSFFLIFNNLHCLNN